jgi:hypothetical protein
MISILIRRGYGFDVMAKALFQALGEPLGDLGRTSVNANADANCNANADANCNANGKANGIAIGKAKAKANYSVILAIEP